MNNNFEINLQENQEKENNPSKRNNKTKIPIQLLGDRFLETKNEEKKIKKRIKGIKGKKKRKLKKNLKRKTKKKMIKTQKNIQMKN